MLELWPFHQALLGMPVLGGPKMAYTEWADELLRLIDEIERFGHEVSVEKDGSLRVWDLNLHHFVALKPSPQDGWNRA
jgi:hypothetical protein